MMTDNENLSNLILERSKKEECKVKCSHELDDMNDENEHLTVIDAISVQTELEQLFNDFNIYNHHIRVFKKLLNLKELKNQLNFFAFSQQNPQKQNIIKEQIQINSNELNEIITTANSIPTNANSPSKNQAKLNHFEELSSTLFKDGELSVMLSPMQIHSQLSKIKEQFIESQLLVTCLIHNVHSLRKHYCGTALDLIASSELLANLERDHSSLKACKSIFKYQCNEKRRQLNKLKQQLKQAHEDFNQLIVKEPKITKLTNEELLLLNKTQLKSKKSPENQWTDNSNEQNDQVNNPLLNNQLNNELNSKINNQEDNNCLDCNSSSSTCLNEQHLSTTSKQKDDKNQDANVSGESNCDSAVHSESEADSLPLQELAAAIYRRKNKLDRLESECYSFLSRLANRNRTIIDDEANDDEKNLEQLNNNQFENSNLILDDEDNFNDYANEYDDEDLLDEEYDDDDVDFDEILNDDPLTTTELHIESLINRFSNVQTAMDTDEELINQNLVEVEQSNNIVLNLVDNLNDLDRVDGIDSNLIDNLIVNNIEQMTNSPEDNDRQNANEENLINDEIQRFSADYLIGQSRFINNTAANYLNENIRNIANDQILNNELADQQSNQNSQILNNSSLNLLAINNETTNDSLLTNLDIRSTLNLSNESLDSILENDDINSSLVPRAVSSNEENTLAKTGEPIGLCRLRRRAVKILASRIRTEKQYYEEKENELKQKLESLIMRNEELEKEIKMKNQPHRQLFLISTAFVFCSLISYFIQTFN